MGSDPQSYLQDQHEREFGEVIRLLQRVYAYLAPINHVHLPDGTILYSTEVSDLLEKLR